MSTNYVKKYGVGQIRLDAPYSHFIHELPLLSFGDVQHSIGLSLVYQSKMTGNPFNISAGYKLSLQKRIIMSSNNYPEAFEDGNGSISGLTAFGSTGNEVYTFDDNSKRILRKNDSGYTLEYPDYSKEIYNSYGMITSVYDKYNESFLVYSYSDNKLISIIYRTDKIIDIAYTNGRISAISYRSLADTSNTVYTSSFVYNTANALTKISHYSGVDYNFSLIISTDTGVFYEAYSTNSGEGYSNVCSQKVEIITPNGSLSSYTATRYIGSKVTDRVNYSMSGVVDSKFSVLDVTDFYGIKTRIQYENGLPAYSYEVVGDMFIENTPNYNYLFNGNVKIHNNNKIDGTLTIDDGIRMMHNPYSNQWYYDFLENDDYQGGYYVMTGWIKPTSTDTSCTVEIHDQLNGDYIDIPVQNLSSDRWSFIAARFSHDALLEFNVSFCDVRGEIESRDFRITFQQPHITSEEDNNRLTNTEDVIFISSTDVPFSEVKFYNGSSELSETITFADALKYLINEKKGTSVDEIYYGNCTGIIKNAGTLLVKYSDNYYDLKNCSIGQRHFRGERKNVTKYTVNNSASNQSLFMTVETYHGASLASSSIYNINLDLVSSEVDSVETVYTRNAKGLITQKVVNNDLSTLAVYDETNTKLLKTIDEFEKETTYVTDDVWGVVTASTFDGITVTNSYDSDKATLTSKTFSKNSDNRSHQFGYSNGNLTSVSDGILGYTFGYTNDNLTEIKKLGSVIENHSFADNDKTVTSSYPSSDSPIYTTEEKVDNYGRPTEVTGRSRNTYSIEPKYSNGTYSATTTDNGSGRLAVSEDLVTGNKRKYAYKFNRLFKVGVFNSSDSQISEEAFEYDGLDRLVSDEYMYDYSNSKSVRSDIEYDTQVADANPDSRIKKYSYKVDGTEKSSTQNFYVDDYKRLTEKRITVGNATYDKDLHYSKTRISRVTDVKNGSTFHNVSYTYDAMGRITSEVDSQDTSFNNSYVYDSFGQLIRENNKALDKTFIYGYNEIGNIVSARAYAYTTGSVEGLSALSTDSYTYDTTNKDKLTYFGGAFAPCNAMGYHSGYNGYIVSWTNGKLTRLSKGFLLTGIHDYNYSYNALGQRVGISYTYTPPTSTGGSAVAIGTLLGYSKSYDYDQSGRLISESRTNEYYGELGDSEKIVFLYDESGMVGFIYTAYGASNTYYYDKNIRGDVIGIYDTSGARIVKYSYDAWGNCTIDSSTTNTALAKINPIRYRGYYYDEDIKLYYLNSRYYGPLWRRFLSPDSTSYLDPETPNGLNLYAYCNNDPVNYSDPSGHNIKGSLTQFFISLYSFVIMSVASIWDDEIRADMQSLNWNPFNEDETVVMNSKKVSFYNGIPVIKFSNEFLSSFSLGGIFLNRENRLKETTIKHEYGHSVQQLILGHDKYLYSVFLPSSIYNVLARNNTYLADRYYSMPWERTADLFGSIDRGNYMDYSLEFSLIYLFLVGLF